MRSRRLVRRSSISLPGKLKQFLDSRFLQLTYRVGKPLQKAEPCVAMQSKRGLDHGVLRQPEALILEQEYVPGITGSCSYTYLLPYTFCPSWASLASLVNDFPSRTYSASLPSLDRVDTMSLTTIVLSRIKRNYVCNKENMDVLVLFWLGRVAVGLFPACERHFILSRPIQKSDGLIMVFAMSGLLRACANVHSSSC